MLSGTKLDIGNIESIFRSIFDIEISSIFRWFSSIYRHLYVESIVSPSKGYDDGVNLSQHDSKSRPRKQNVLRWVRIPKFALLSCMHAPAKNV